MKVLFVANIHKHFKAFHIPYIQYLKGLGCEVHVAANDPETIISEADKQYNLLIHRNPFSLNNLKAIKELKKIIAKENYGLIHCHTAMGSVVARLAAFKFRKNGNLKVLYTVHGFHFYKGAPKIYWLIYYSIEKYLSKNTDAIITINDEDFNLAKEKKFKAKDIFKIPGMGINPEKFKGISLEDKEIIRIKNGYKKDTFILIYVAEFIERKDHEFILEILPLIKNEINDFKFIFAGRGKLKVSMEKYVNKIGVSNYVDFLGFRKDIGELIVMSDVGVSVSKQEGLPMNIVEEMYAGKPVIATKIRGHIDLIEDGKTGFLFPQGDRFGFINKIITIYKDKKLQELMSINAKNRAQLYELPNCIQDMGKIYSKFLDS
ncbi:glycosyltransferase family 4 protein [Cyclobacterium sp. SYSU L10401]|uniref:glycosyltransferase family 4 protein n=1 Tax=Cyclobacterium sp. SYSU L10401 TaxID=2678657 RepID=UPI0013D76C74|nr:glycosyltransferase family 4 protein [Cyclobacterium sp. SYSU L10401]